MATPTPSDLCKHTLKTDRLTLHIYDTSQADQSAHLVKCFNDPVTLVEMGDYNVSSNEVIISLSKACNLRPNAIHSISSTEGFVYIIHLDDPATGASPMIGMISLMQRGADVATDIGWITLNQYSGKGYTTEAAKEALRHWRQDVGVEGITCSVVETNKASQRIAEKIGMKRGDIFVNPRTGRNSVRYALL